MPSYKGIYFDLEPPNGKEWYPTEIILPLLVLVFWRSFVFCSHLLSSFCLFVSLVPWIAPPCHGPYLNCWLCAHVVTKASLTEKVLVPLLLFPRIILARMRPPLDPRYDRVTSPQLQLYWNFVSFALSVSPEFLTVTDFLPPLLILTYHITKELVQFPFVDLKMYSWS